MWQRDGIECCFRRCNEIVKILRWKTWERFQKNKEQCFRTMWRLSSLDSQSISVQDLGRYSSRPRNIERETSPPLCGIWWVMYCLGEPSHEPVPPPVHSLRHRRPFTFTATAGTIKSRLWSRVERAANRRERKDPQNRSLENVLRDIGLSPSFRCVLNDVKGVSVWRSHWNLLTREHRRVRQNAKRV